MEEKMEKMKFGDEPTDKVVSDDGVFTVSTEIMSVVIIFFFFYTYLPCLP